jgi:nicotinamide-nucleotide amidase
VDEAGAQRAVDVLRERDLTVATGESVTAGLLAGALADIPGCSSVLRGGVVAYQADVKAALLGVTEAELAEGLVSEAVGLAMARGAARVLGADVGIGTTGVAGPEPHDGTPVGTVWIAVTGPRGERAERLALAGDRADIRRQTVEACLALLVDVAGGNTPDDGAVGHGQEPTVAD